MSIDASKIRVFCPGALAAIDLDTFIARRLHGVPGETDYRISAYRISARSVSESYSAASLWPSLALSLWISSSAASEITVPGGKIASAPAA